MCGIWFSIGMEPPKSVIDIVRHRGPDAEGWRQFASRAGTVTLGHRRLAIIDLSHGADQPMASDDARYWIVFNGEIYNYKELGVELSAKGHKFRTRSDTEVLLKAYAEWGPACLARFNGMFAFAVWDAKSETLFAARDRFGIKPLYLRTGERGFCLASEIKQILHVAPGAPNLHAGAAFDFLAQGGLTDHRPETMFEGILRLRGGECLTMKAGGAPEVRSWYALAPGRDVPAKEPDRIVRFGELLKDAVCLRLRADVAVGTCLSGGLDSSSIVTLAAELLQDGAVNTFSGCFDVPEVDERPYIHAVVEKTGAHAREVFPRPEEFAADIEGTIALMEEPFENPGVYLQNRVFRSVGETNVKVILDGQGADEHLAGYGNMWNGVIAELLRTGRLRALARELAVARGASGISLSKQLRQLASTTKALLGLGQALDPVRAAPDLLRRDFVSTAGPRAFAEPEPQALNRLVPYRLRVAKLPALLRFEDRNSMAYSVEARVPFLDHRLVEYSLALDAPMKLRDGVTKYILREAMRDRLPTKVYVRRDKLGFAIPDDRWMTGPLRESVRESVLDLARRAPHVFDREKLERYVAAHIERPDFRSGLWRYYFFSRWLGHFRVQ